MKLAVTVLFPLFWVHVRVLRLVRWAGLSAACMQAYPFLVPSGTRTPSGAGGEVQLADAINLRAQQVHVNAVPLSGERYDCGSKFDYLEAIVDFALDHTEYGPAFGALIAQRAHSKAA